VGLDANARLWDGSRTHQNIERPVKTTGPRRRLFGLPGSPPSRRPGHLLQKKRRRFAGGAQLGEKLVSIAARLRSAMETKERQID